MIRLSVTTLLITSAVAFAALPDAIKTDNGQVSGATGKDASIHAFKGIPYAAPPTGENRWRAPQPAAKWDGVRPGDKFSAPCLSVAGRVGAQGGGAKGGGAKGGGAKGGGAKGGGKGPAPANSEDCLYINVWTGAQSAGEKRPVFVWTYGGGFTGGSGSEARYDGEALAKKGVVVVTYNYRLGMFGFLAHPELTKESPHKSSGNYGMMDMLAALQWVRKNIATFGGDPNKVTIGGESAGGILVGAMVASPEGKGLFERAIAQSAAWMGLSMSKMRTLADAEAAGARAAGSNTIAQLRAMTPQELGAAMGATQAGIIVDGWVMPEDASLTFAHGKQNKVDILVGSNQDEGTFAGFARPATAQTAQTYGDLAADFTKLYPYTTPEEATASGVARVRDEVGWHERIWAQDATKTGKKAFVYYFKRVAPGQEARGATHTAELPYMFQTPAANSGWVDIDTKLSDQMSSYWANFIANGNPNGQGLPQWPAYDPKKNDAQAMVFGDTTGFGPQIDEARLKFFDAAYARMMK